MPVPSRYFLINASHRRTWVLVDDKPVRLPEVHPPLVLADHTSSVREDIEVLIAGPDTEMSAQIEAREETVASLVLGNPPVVDNVLYLVEPETKMQFPHREDFVVPAAYGMWTSVKLAKKMDSKSKKKRRKAYKKNIKTLSHGERFPLVAISRAPLPIAGPETSVLAIDEA